jgi:hypothetical protein
MPGSYRGQRDKVLAEELGGLLFDWTESMIIRDEYGLRSDSGGPITSEEYARYRSENLAKSPPPPPPINGFHPVMRVAKATNGFAPKKKNATLVKQRA